jgi:hypothetical protein
MQRVGWMFLWSLLSGVATAQQLNIPRIETPPELADFVEMEPPPEVRNQMTVITDFMQRQPYDGAPSTQRTDVYLGYDQRNLYVVFVAFDSDPTAIRGNLAPREQIDDDDTVGILIDTFHDRRTGYGFRSNPLGVQWDARWSEVTKGEAFDPAYEAVWYTEGRMTDQGYVVKMTIPFRTLRFAEGTDEPWGVQFERVIPRASESAYWPSYTQRIDGRLNQAAAMEGIRGVSPGRNILLTPYAFVRDYEVLDTDPIEGPPGFTSDTENEFGLDAKFVLRDSMVLDLTLNPDFSQVESDQPQVTANERFEVRFPERRPFFLENADYFTTETALVFTRRIVDPNAGLRFTGRQGPWGIGALLMDDEAPGQGRDPSDPLSGEAADVAIFRAFRDFSEQSRMGMLYTERQFGNYYNKVASIDSRMRLTPNWTTELQFVDTASRSQSGEELDGRQTNIRFDRAGRHALVHAHWLDQSEGFRADLGFLNRTYSPDTKGSHARVQYRIWQDEDVFLNRWGPNVNLVFLEDQQGVEIYQEINPQIDLAWAGDSTLSVGFKDIEETLRPKDFPVLAGNRTYPQQRGTLAFETFSLARFGFTLNFEAGDAINNDPATGAEPELVDSATTTFDFLWRPSDRLRVDTSFIQVALDDPLSGGPVLENDIVRTRWNYQFTKEWSLRFIAQQEETKPTELSGLTLDKNRNYDVLVRYVLNPWSALYVGYNSNSSNYQLVETEDGTEVVRTNGLDQDGEQFFVKFSYLLQP